MNAAQSDQPANTAPWASAFTAMATASGRDFEGQWRGTWDNATVTCTSGSHDVCGGWVAPLVYAYRKCICPCHDDSRPGNNEARADVRTAIDAARGSS